MNAHALLTSQGWRGSGHSLHPTSDSTGLSRPLLVSQKANTLGLGKKQHKTADMWWMNAFDKSLKGLDTTTEGKVVQTVTNAGLDMVVKGGAKFVGNSGGLYASFVRGEPLSGTITPEETKSESSKSSREASPKKSRKERVEEESKEERRARKAAKRARRAQKATAEKESAEKESTPEEPKETSLKNQETKEERRERKERKRQKLAAKAAKEAEVAIEKKKKRRKE